MNINARMARFRVTSRDLWNFYYKPDGVDGLHQFNSILIVLFEQMAALCAVTGVRYGDANARIQVKLGGTATRAPILVSTSTGSFSSENCSAIHIDPLSRMSYMQFFDWNQMEYIDHKYVRVRLDSFPSHPEMAGKEALIEYECVEFEAVP